MIRSDTIPSFQVFRFLFLSAIMTTDPLLQQEACLPPELICRSRRLRTYSRDYSFHITRLHAFKSFARFAFLHVLLLREKPIKVSIQHLGWH